MNHIQRCLRALARQGRALLALAATTPAALASLPLPPGNPNPAPPAAVHPAVTGGMPGWQITLIAVAAALVAAVAAVLLDRARTRRHLAHPAP
jgi:polyferredoxin